MTGRSLKNPMVKASSSWPKSTLSRRRSDLSKKSGTRFADKRRNPVSLIWKLRKGQIRPNICCLFENLAVNYFTWTALILRTNFQMSSKSLSLFKIPHKSLFPIFRTLDEANKISDLCCKLRDERREQEEAVRNSQLKLKSDHRKVNAVWPEDFI